LLCRGLHIFTFSPASGTRQLPDWHDDGIEKLTLCFVESDP